MSFVPRFALPFALSLAIVFGLLGTRPAAARDQAHPSPEARLHYERGIAHYNLGEFPAAIDELKQAYALSNAPGLLFNLAQAERLAGQPDQALYFYRTYLRLEPDAPNRADVEHRIDEMEKAVAARAEAPPAKAPAPPPSAPKISAPPSAPAAIASAPARSLAPSTSSTSHRMRARRERIAGLCLGVGGLGLIATAAGLTARAASASNQLTALASAGGDWSAQEQAVYTDGTRSQAAATALYAIGGAAAAGGAILTALGFRAPRHFAAAPLSGGAMATLRGAF
jgi:tetratricopeptide (TPR) repeat protein